MFRVKATGNGLLFQWQKNRRDLSDGDRYCDTLQVEMSDKGCCRCHIKNDLGEKFSKEAVFTVSKLVIVVDVMDFTKKGMRILLQHESRFSLKNTFLLCGFGMHVHLL